MLEAWLERAVGTVWNYPVVGLCLFAGLYFTIRMAFIQLRCFSHAIALVSGKYDHSHEPGELTHFQALTAALSGTVGLGNIAGVAIAIGMGGPGAVFWMWLIAFMGMATKYVECALGTMYRKPDPATGKMRGGAMYYITEGLGERWWPMATFFAFCLMMGSFGAANMFQSNQVALALAKYADVPFWLTGVALAVLVAITIIGGIKRIGQVTSKIVPSMCVLYLIGAFIVCFLNIDRVPAAFATILVDAFTGTAAVGGVVGIVIITGVRRAIFSNEAGMGSAPIAHASVKTEYPIREGIVASLGPFIDTMVVCTATALVIILSGHFGTEMYESVHTASLVDERESPAVGGGWALTNQGIPKQTDKVRNFRAGRYALAHPHGNEGSSAISTPINLFPKKLQVVAKRAERKESHVCDGLRFSCFRGEGKLAVDLIDRNGGVVNTLAVDHDGGTVMTNSGHTGEEKALLSISPCSGDHQWHSHIITFHTPFKKMVAKAGGSMDSLRLRLRPEASPTVWYTDRFQSVNKLEGIALTTESFDKYLKGFGSMMLTLCIALFCYSTMITWAYYGEVAARYVFGYRASLPFRILFVIAVYFGAVLRLGPVLNFSDLMIGLMVIPNFIGMFSLSHVVVKETKAYFKKLHAGDFEEKLQPAFASSSAVEPGEGPDGL